MSWIISRRQDLLWFHLSALPALALGAFFAFGPASAELLMLCAWGVIFDGTHVFGTWARSYLGPDRDGLPGVAQSLLLFAIGPAAAVVDHLGVPIFAAFLLTANLWAYWHLVRQHWGFVCLYRRDAPAPTRLGWLLWLGCVYPFARFGLSDTYLASGLPLLFPVAALPRLRVALDLVAAGALFAVGVARILDRRPLRLGPAHLYVAVAVSLHALSFAFVPRLLPITATLTLFHNLQYHRIVWHYEHRRGRVPFGGLVRYLGAGLLVGLLWYLPRLFATLAAPTLARDLLVGACWGVAFHHYLVDGRIWRLRKPVVREALAS